MTTTHRSISLTAYLLLLVRLVSLVSVSAIFDILIIICCRSYHKLTTNIRTIYYSLMLVDGGSIVMIRIQTGSVCQSNLLLLEGLFCSSGSFLSGSCRFSSDRRMLDRGKLVVVDQTGRDIGTFSFAHIST